MGDVAAADEPERIDCFTCGGRGTLDSVHVGIVDPPEGLLVATAHLTLIPVEHRDEYRAHLYTAIEVVGDKVYFEVPHTAPTDVTDQFPEPPVPGEWWWRVTDLRELAEPITEYAAPEGSPEWNRAIESAGIRPFVPIDVVPGLSPCPPELAELVKS
jgi:hypothetical protein